MAEKRKIYTSFHDIPPREYMYFPKGSIEVEKPGRFSRVEITHILISILVLTVAFSFWITGGIIRNQDFNIIIKSVPYAFAGVLTAFFVHEVSHKFIAQKLGLWAEYRMYPLGLILALILSVFTGWVFAAPGAVMFMGGSKSYENGKIAVAGPLANIIIASAALPLYIVFYESTIAPLIGFICLINAFLGTFNLLPFGPLDGTKIIRWNATAWIVLLIYSIILLTQIFPRFAISVY